MCDVQSLCIVINIVLEIPIMFNFILDEMKPGRYVLLCMHDIKELEKMIVFVRSATCMLLHMESEINVKLYIWVPLLFCSLMNDLGKIILTLA